MFTIKEGVCHIDGRPKMPVTADYPYYRDAADNWEDRLVKLKESAVSVITIYIPWRHHQPDQDVAPDFSAALQDNRDIHRFLALCHKLDLPVIAKPGPFIHAELNYGGLPDWVCPDSNKSIEPTLNAQNDHIRWYGSRFAEGSSEGDSQREMEWWSLPAPFDPTFMAMVKEWMRIVGEEVIKPNLYPHGPITLLQIANEGIYSNGQHAPWAYDYSSSALAFFRTYLQKEYKDIQKYNTVHGSALTDWAEIQPPRAWVAPAALTGLRAYEDWGHFQAEYLGELYRAWGDEIGVDIPILTNLNPPLAADYGLDAWFCRVQPERWTNVHYGFTNWIGVVSADPSAYDRYLICAKRAPGLNMEENWGFSVLYDPAYIDASTSFYQTLQVLNGGATGFNVYTGVSTAHWDDTLDISHSRPYPDCSPITATGEVTSKGEIVKWLGTFFGLYGEEFLACQSPTVAAWGLYLPYATVAVWVPGEEAEAWPTCGRSLRTFQAEMRQAGLDYEIVNIQTASLSELARLPRIVLHGASFMERAVQEKLASYVAQGGQLIFVGQVPTLDENFAPCALLEKVCDLLPTFTPAAFQLWARQEKSHPILEKGKGDIWVRSHPQRDLHFITALIPAEGTPELSYTVELAGVSHRLDVTAAAGAGAILRVENGVITDLIIKGVNDYLSRRVVPNCTLDGKGPQNKLTSHGDFASLAGKYREIRPEPALTLV